MIVKNEEGKVFTVVAAKYLSLNEDAEEVTLKKKRKFKKRKDWW